MATISSNNILPLQEELSIHIVEDHNEVLEYIYADIGNKKLPFSGNCLVHFDSHPDLLCPELLADLVYDKASLFQKISIGDWILPAVYAGHIDSIIWLKPPWSSQITDGHYSLSVGKDIDNHLIRVNLPIPYYLSEGFYSSSVKLQNTKTIPLHVFTVEWSKDNTKWYNEVKSLIMKSSAWILDVDLDFYSTVNPFKEWFTEDQYTYLGELYKLNLPAGSMPTEQDAVNVNKSRIAKLSSLIKYWSDLPLSDDADISNLLDIEIKDLIGQEKDDNEIIDANDIHVAGMMTDLPHHISTKEEIDLLLIETKQFLAQLKEESLLPNIVTISRSSTDPYTPPYQVDEVQAAVLDIISDTWKLRLITHKHYLHLSKWS